MFVGPTTPLLLFTENGLLIAHFLIMIIGDEVNFVVFIILTVSELRNVKFRQGAVVGTKTVLGFRLGGKGTKSSIFPPDLIRF